MKENFGVEIKKKNRLRRNDKSQVEEPPEEAFAQMEKQPKHDLGSQSGEDDQREQKRSKQRIYPRLAAGRDDDMPGG